MIGLLLAYNKPDLMMADSKVECLTATAEAITNNLMALSNLTHTKIDKARVMVKTKVMGIKTITNL